MDFGGGYIGCELAQGQVQVQVQNYGWMLDVGCWMLDVGCWMHEATSKWRGGAKKRI